MHTHSHTHTQLKAMYGFRGMRLGNALDVESLTTPLLWFWAKGILLLQNLVWETSPLDQGYFSSSFWVSRL